ncbi:hypothetical protein OG618_06835 [Kitasatospora sp. NBC_01246]|uniref:hypothetical protein n=1 Tax=Kitasatospora sp. NBC_01246 TaxID=2903570 RepID=UPI002E374D46|nr:hypothetical protein [Kitasatospora sp. NBC_01246]
MLQMIGFGLVIAVLVDATLVRAVLVPASMKLLGHWAWWAPRPLRNLRRRLGLAHREGASTGRPRPAGAGEPLTPPPLRTR